MQPEEVQLPIFVYGTLRPGASHYGTVREFVDDNGFRPASLQGFLMFDFKGFPGIIELSADSKASPVVGEILFIQRDRYHEAIERMDRLESNGYLFNRTDRFYADIWPKEENTLPWEDRRKNSVRVWVYVVNGSVLSVNPLRQIVGNDWMNRGG